MCSLPCAPQAPGLMSLLQDCCRPTVLWMEWHVNHLSDEACWSANVFAFSVQEKPVSAVFSWKILVPLLTPLPIWMCTLTCGVAGMNRYRYFIFNQKSMVVLGLVQITCATICIISGLIDGTFRKESVLSTSKIPIWAGAVSFIPPPPQVFAFVRQGCKTLCKIWIILCIMPFFL